jgi:hypothetical protein
MYMCMCHSPTLHFTQAPVQPIAVRLAANERVNLSWVPAGPSMDIIGASHALVYVYVSVCVYFFDSRVYFLP